MPATLALVADLYPAERRGFPLGVVGAVQELGSVLGPLYGAAVLALGGWRDIFWINLAVGLVLAAALLEVRRRSRSGAPPGVAAGVAVRLDPVLGLLTLLSAVAVVLVMTQPRRLVTDVTLGGPFVPWSGTNRWWSTAGAVALVLLLLLLWRLHPVRWLPLAREADLAGALLLSVALGGVILAFATADPQVQVFSPLGPWFLAVSVLAAVCFWWHNRRTRYPLLPTDALRARPAWGALVVSLFVGAGLIAALVDIPIAARVTVFSDSQLDAALVLVRFLIALPAGAVAGGWLLRRAPSGVITLAGMVFAAVAFVWMSQWTLTSLEHPVATVPLVVGGFGFGLALAPVNAALLAATRDSVHGVASALLVVARMVGMLVGISALTTIGLRRFYAVSADIPPPMQVCPDGKSRCPAYSDLLQSAGLAQLEAVFVGAAVCTLVAGLLALWLFAAPTRRSSVGAD
ncbi:MAG: MFS transporter [Nocardioidaceae bacterium]